eukprot:Seg4824.5 transcript_id=Seg4824.5/GoldUCD/mRNA.D3Y31 product="hypothetical protein" protein_id=Seg4824.5/GoldUCD/D3Y31
MCSIIHSYKLLRIELDFERPSYPLACIFLFDRLRQFTATKTNLMTKQVDCLKMLEKLNRTELQFGMQSDAHEIMDKIINSVNSEPNSDIWQLTFGKMSTCFSCGKEEVLEKDLKVSILTLEREVSGETNLIQSAINNYFADEQIKDVNCKCGGNSHSFESPQIQRTFKYATKIEKSDSSFLYSQFGSPLNKQ